MRTWAREAGTAKLTRPRSARCFRSSTRCVGNEAVRAGLIPQLKSPEYADRTWACAAICNLIQNDPATRRMFQSKNVVGELIERLTDDVDEVVVEASGALR